MKKLTLIAVSFLLLFAFNCSEEDTNLQETSLTHSELSFSSSKDQLGEISSILGIQKLSNGKFTSSSTFEFDVIAENVDVNYEALNLNSTHVSFNKLAKDSYRISCQIPDLGRAVLNFNKNYKTITFTIDGNEIPSNQLSTYSAKYQLAVVVLTNLFAEATQTLANPTKELRGGRVEKAYYGYTVGWGFTQEESVDHEASVRAGAGATIEQYSCVYLGTSTTCIFGSLGCTTISTYKCDDGEATPE